MVLATWASKPGKQVPTVEDRKEPSVAKAVAYFPELWW